MKVRFIFSLFFLCFPSHPFFSQRLDAALSRAPSPPLSSAPREAAVWTGVLVIPPTQCDVLQSYLTAEGRPSVVNEKGKIEPERESSLSSCLLPTFKDVFGRRSAEKSILEN
jgi:hypothetical protein